MHFLRCPTPASSLETKGAAAGDGAGALSLLLISLSRFSYLQPSSQLVLNVVYTWSERNFWYYQDTWDEDPEYIAVK